MSHDPDQIAPSRSAALNGADRRHREDDQRSAARRSVAQDNADSLFGVPRQQLERCHVQLLQDAAMMFEREVFPPAIATRRQTMTDWAAWSAEARAAYIASIIDNHSHIGIKRREPTSANKMRSPKYSIALSLSFSHRVPVQFVATVIGAEHKVRQRKRPGKAMVYELDIENERVAAILRLALPFLLEKQERAAAMLRLADLRATSRRQRTKQVGTSFIEGGRGGIVEVPVLALSDEFNAACETIYQAMRLNSRLGQWGKS